MIDWLVNFSLDSESSYLDLYPGFRWRKTYLPSCILVNLFFNKFLCTRQSMKLTLPVFWFVKEHVEEPLRCFVKKEHRRPAAPAGFDSFSFSELNIGRARILQVSFPCRLQIYDTCQVRWDWQCKWGRYEHLETVLCSSSSPSGFQTSCNWNLCNAQWCILVWTL